MIEKFLTISSQTSRAGSVRKRLRRNAATVFELSIAEHAQRAFGGTYNLFFALWKRSFL